MNDWRQWFIDAKGKEPGLVDYLLAMREGPTEYFRDEAARAFARTFIREDGSVSPGVGQVTQPDTFQNYNPNNAFFLEWEEKVDKFHLDRNKAYQDWLKHAGPAREEYKQKLLQKKRIKSVENAWKNRGAAKKAVEDLTAKWNRLYDHGYLDHGTNISLAGKFMDELRKDPTMKRYLPAKLVDNPGTRLSAPFYDEVRKFIRNEKEEYEGFFAIKGDYRLSAMNELRMEADRDFKLRKDPERAKLYGAKLRERRAELNKARQESLEAKQAQKAVSKEQAKDNERPRKSDSLSRD